MKLDEDTNRQGRVTLIELNEFNPVFLGQAAERLNLKNVKEMLSWPHTSTTTDDLVEHQGLDPWVQWVNVHTGQPSSNHEVKRLGDTTTSPYPPFWINLAEHGKSWGAWGVMNTPQVTDTECRFFFPDPWSYQENAFPKELEDVLRLPRYVSKNYLDLDRRRAAREAFALVRAMSRPGNWPASFDFSRRFLTECFHRKISIHTLTTFVDYLGFCFFMEKSRKLAPDFRVIFLNLIAHLQHQFWSADEEIHPEMELGLKLTDRMLGRIIREADPNEKIIVMNGLRQKNVDGENICVYRQNNPEELLRWLDCPFNTVEQCMTHDAHVIFDDEVHADRAFERLEACRLSDGTKAFFVERLSETKLFYQIDFEHVVPEHAEITSGNYSCKLSDVISVYAVRTGAHVPDGDIYSRAFPLPETMHNHELAEHIQQHFGVS